MVSVNSFVVADIWYWSLTVTSKVKEVVESVTKKEKGLDDINEVDADGKALLDDDGKQIKVFVVG